MHYAFNSLLSRVIGVIRLDTPTIRSITRDPGSTKQAAAVVAVVAIAAALGSVDGRSAGLLLIALGAVAVWIVRGGHSGPLAESLHAGGHSVGFGMRHLARMLPGVAQPIRGHGALSVIALVVILVLAVIVLNVIFFWAIGGVLLPLVAWLVFSGVAFFASAHVFGEPTTRAEFVPILRLVGFALAPGVLAIFNVIPFIGGVALTVAIVWTLVAATFAIRQTVMIGTLRATLTTIFSSLVTIVTCGALAMIFG